MRILMAPSEIDGGQSVTVLIVGVESALIEDRLVRRLKSRLRLLTQSMSYHQ